MSAAVPGGLARARALLEQEQARLQAQVQRRLILPLDQWDPICSVEALTSTAFEQINDMERLDSRGA